METLYFEIFIENLHLFFFQETTAQITVTMIPASARPMIAAYVRLTVILKKRNIIQY